MECPFCKKEITRFFSMDFCDQSNRHCPRCGELLPVVVAKQLLPWYSPEEDAPAAGDQNPDEEK